MKYFLFIVFSFQVLLYPNPISNFQIIQYDPSLISGYKLYPDLVLHRKRMGYDAKIERIKAEIDFNCDGKIDLLLSAPTCESGNAGNGWEVFLRVDQKNLKKIDTIFIGWGGLYQEIISSNLAVYTTWHHTGRMWGDVVKYVVSGEKIIETRVRDIFLTEDTNIEASFFKNNFFDKKEVRFLYSKTANEVVSWSTNKE